MTGTFSNCPKPLEEWLKARNIDVAKCRIDGIQEGAIAYAITAKAAPGETPMWYRIEIDLCDWSYQVIGPKGFYENTYPIFEQGNLVLEPGGNEKLH